jgi:3-hydroxyisobutyrate dehydrogenase
MLGNMFIGHEDFVMIVGLIGLGNLGYPVGKNILKGGHALVVHDLNRATADKLIERGATWADSPMAVAQQTDVVVTILPSPMSVCAVVEGENGLIHGWSAGKAWIDSSTNDLTELQRLAQKCAEIGVDVIEAPMTGGIPRAHEGTMTSLVGANRAAFDKYLPLIQSYAGDILYLGEIGSASTAKVITNMLAFIHLWALGEGLMLGKRNGLETGALFEAIKASCGNSFVAETEGPEILNGTYDYGFTLELAAKDSHLAYELARRGNVPLEMGGMVEQLIHRGIGRYGKQAWSTQLVKLLEDDLNTDLRADGYESQPIDRALE